MKEKASAVIRANKKYLSDGFSTQKNGHICIPVKRDFKQKFDGAVIEQSSTGSTLAMRIADRLADIMMNCSHYGLRKKMKCAVFYMY